MRYTKHNGAQKTEINRIENGRALREADRDRQRAESSADPLCTCGWITALPWCPSCGGARP